MPVMSSLPNELWMTVFESLNSPSDLAKVLRTCKLFHNLTIHILHRNLIWNDPRHFAQGLHIWTNNPGILTVPRTLTVGISQAQASVADLDIFRERAVVVTMNGTLHHILPVARPSNIFNLLQETTVSRIRPSFVASQQLYQAITAQIITFSQLSNLTFKNAILPTNIYEIIHGIPSLRALRIEFCTFDADTIDSSWDHTALPITELSLLSLDGGNHVDQAMFLAKAHNLRVLRFDFTVCIFRLFTRSNDAGLHTVPKHLESINARLPEKKYWPSNPQEAQRLYVLPLIAFLAMCSSVVHLSIGNYMPGFTLPDNILPNLCSYDGSMSTVVAVAGNRPIIRLDIRDVGSKLSDFIDVLTLVGECHASLQELSAYVPYWDIEVLYAVTHLFPNLRKLHIRYGLGCLSEDLIISIGPHFVARAPYMHTLHIFSGRSAAELLAPQCFDPAIEPTDFDGEEIRDPEAELKGLVKSWDRYCPQLREVQLLRGFVWRKAEVRPGMKSTGWEKRPYQRVNGERDYGF